MPEPMMFPVAGKGREASGLGRPQKAGLSGQLQMLQRGGELGLLPGGGP